MRRSWWDELFSGYYSPKKTSQRKKNSNSRLKKEKANNVNFDTKKSELINVEIKDIKVKEQNDVTKNIEENVYEQIIIQEKVLNSPPRQNGKHIKPWKNEEYNDSDEDESEEEEEETKKELTTPVNVYKPENSVKHQKNKKTEHCNNINITNGLQSKEKNQNIIIVSPGRKEESREQISSYHHHHYHISDEEDKRFYADDLGSDNEYTETELATDGEDGDLMDSLMVLNKMKLENDLKIANQKIKLLEREKRELLFKLETQQQLYDQRIDSEVSMRIISSETVELLLKERDLLNRRLDDQKYYESERNLMISKYKVMEDEINLLKQSLTVCNTEEKMPNEAFEFLQSRLNNSQSILENCQNLITEISNLLNDRKPEEKLLTLITEKQALNQCKMDEELKNAKSLATQLSELGVLISQLNQSENTPNRSRNNNDNSSNSSTIFETLVELNQHSKYNNNNIIIDNDDDQNNDGIDSSGYSLKSFSKDFDEYDESLGFQNYSYYYSSQPESYRRSSNSPILSPLNKKADMIIWGGSN